MPTFPTDSLYKTLTVLGILLIGFAGYAQLPSHSEFRHSVQKSVENHLETSVQEKIRLREIYAKENSPDTKAMLEDALKDLKVDQDARLAALAKFAENEKEAQIFGLYFNLGILTLGICLMVYGWRQWFRKIQCHQDLLLESQAQEATQKRLPTSTSA